MTTMNIEVEMPNDERLALYTYISRVLVTDNAVISEDAKNALYKVREAAMYAVEVKNADSMEAAS